MRPAIYRLISAAALLALTAGICDRVPERLWDRGDFHPVAGNTRGYSLPAGIEVTDLAGYDDAIPASDLPLNLTLRNTSPKRINFSFPAGLVFGPLVVDYQYAMLVQDFAISVPATADTTVLVPTYCCNENLDFPDSDAGYEITQREYDRETKELFDLVAAKRLEGDTAVMLAQDALFEITDGDSLTDDTRELLRALPDR
jgi:hypothetical protein